MQTALFNITNGDGDQFPGIEVRLSFEPYLRYLKNRAKNENSVKKDFFKKIINGINRALNDHGPLDDQNFFKFDDEFSLIHASMNPPLSEEGESLWALGYPMGQKICFGTDNFYGLLRRNECCTQLTMAPTRPYADAIFSEKTRMLYSFILERLFGVSSSRHFEFIHSFIDDATGLQKYYRINIDHTFVDISIKGELPAIDRLKVRDEFSKTFKLDILESLLPLDLFRLEGFSILTVHDVTTEQVFENIKNIIIKGDDIQDSNDEVISSLKTLAGNADIEFSLLPFLKLNGRVIFDHSRNSTSALLLLIGNSNLTKERIEILLARFIERPEILFFSRDGFSDNYNTEPFLYGLKDFGIEDYALIPIIHNKEMVGVMEVFSKKKDVMDDRVLSRVFSTNTLLAQLLKDEIVEFTTKLNGIIKDKFTSLQSAVQWKFNDMAWEYLQNLQGTKPRSDIGDIKFEQVYPLYGAIDIRNSTVERNSAAFLDIIVHLELLEKVLVQLKGLINMAVLDEMIFNCRRWVGKIVDEESIDHFQIQLNEFLDRDVTGILAYFKENSPESLSIIGDYEHAVDPDNGMVHRNRKALEASVLQINTGINDYLESARIELQNSYPSYFEKYRSDGVEYDIYIGQSIAPDKPFNEVYLKNLRLWQLTSMADMAKITHGLLGKMEQRLYTTQLIFVNSTPIDISFRTDERRFDVEGAYNIRYQIIKKRIDKVTIKDTGERLTQPGKIALVYFLKKDIREYSGYILYLQKHGVLLDNLEELELEELQGVKGLRALRVGVNLDN